MAKEKFKKVTKFGIVIRISAAFLALFVIMLGGRIAYELNSTNALETQEIIQGIKTVKSGWTNIYLLETDGGYIAIDAGQNDSSETKEEFNKLGVSSDDVIAVFLTHAHDDHIAALDLFDGKPVYGSENTIFDKVTVKMRDGEIAEIGGFSIQSIFTQGHCADSVCYLINGRYLFTGDTFSLKNDKVDLVSILVNESNKVQKADIKRLSEINSVEYYFTAHFGFTNKPVFPSG